MAVAGNAAAGVGIQAAFVVEFWIGGHFAVFQHADREDFGARHPERAGEAFGEPADQAYVVRVVMRADHAG